MFRRIFWVLLALVLLAGGCGGNTEQNANLLPSGPDYGEHMESGAAADQPVTDDRASTWSQTGADRLIIKNGTISLLVDDTGSAMEAITAIAAQYGGYVLASESHQRGDTTTAAITVAVESSGFEAAMNDLRDVGQKVLDETVSGEDVTDEYVDLASRLRSLEATRDRLMTFMEQTASVEEALKVNEELGRIEELIEQVKGRMNYLSGRAAYSTITAQLQEEAPPPPKSSKGWSPRGALDAAWDAQKSVVRFLVDAVIWLAVFLGPYLLIAALVGLGVYRWRGRVLRRR